MIYYTINKILGKDEDGWETSEQIIYGDGRTITFPDLETAESYYKCSEFDESTHRISIHKAEDDDTEYEDIEELCNDGLFRKIERKYWELKAHFDKTVREKIEGKDEKKKVKDNRRSNARKRKNKRGIKRSFNQGFSV